MRAKHSELKNFVKDFATGMREEDIWKMVAMA